jgi:hypothetical protein
MPKKQIGKKRPRPGAKQHRGKSVLGSGMANNPVEPQMLRTIKRWSFFRRVLGTPADIRSFQIYITKSGYYTVYLKDSATTAPQT